MRRTRFLVVFVYLAVLSILDSPGVCVAGAQAHPPLSLPEVQRAVCGDCHERQARSQPETLMGRALALPGNNAVLGKHPVLTVQKGPYTYTVKTENGRSTYSVFDGSSTISVPIVWSFGAGNQTWVLQRDGQFYESLVSYYSSIDGLDTTTGDASIVPSTLEQAFGRRLDAIDTRACFGCHSTGSSVDGRLSLATIHPGASCIRCHTGALDHQASMENGDLTVYPPDLGRLDAEDLSTLCGQCHRTWEMVVRSHWGGEANVRFQPYRLANSRCFNGSDPRISCIACHDPHQPVIQDAAFYDSKCLACHTVTSPRSAQSAHVRPAAAIASVPPSESAPQPGSCPVAASRCVTCHMPRTRMLGGHLVFTDHEIRVVRPGESYPN
jgi:hypothetical protein